MGKNSIVLTLCLLLGMSTIVYAQYPKMDIRGYRVYHIYTGAAKEANAFFMVQSTNNYTELNDKTYIVYELTEVPSNYTEIPQTLLYTQEGQKIYRYDETRQEDVLMFDFSLNEGDVFTTPQGTRMEVVEVGDCKEYLNDWLVREYSGKRLKLRDCNNASLEDIWVEGIGSLYTGILPQELIPNSRECSLNFCSMGTWAAVFPQNTPYYKSTQFLPFELPIELIDTDQPEWCNYMFSGDTLVISGCAVMYSLPVITSCFVHENIIEFQNIESHYHNVLINGLYLFATSLAPHGFEIKLPGFLPGEYTIMAGEQKLATVVCGTTFINTLEISAKHSYQFHDLLGRPINSLQKGINIINGNKIMVK